MENIAHISKDISQYRQTLSQSPRDIDCKLVCLLNNTLISTTNIITVIFKQDGQGQLLDTAIKENKCHLHTTPQINYRW